MEELRDFDVGLNTLFDHSQRSLQNKDTLGAEHSKNKLGNYISIVLAMCVKTTQWTHHIFKAIRPLCWQIWSHINFILIEMSSHTRKFWNQIWLLFTHMCSNYNHGINAWDSSVYEGFMDLVHKTNFSLTRRFLQLSTVLVYHKFREKNMAHTSSLNW